MPSFFRRLLKPVLSAAIISLILVAAFAESSTAVPSQSFSMDLLGDAELSRDAIESHPGISTSLPEEAAFE